MGPSEVPVSSEDILLQDFLSQVKAAEEEGAHVDGLEVALQHHLGHSSPHGRGVLQPVTAEARSEVHVDNQGVGAHHAVLVKGVVVVIASPGAPNLWVHKILGFSEGCRPTRPSLVVREQHRYPLPATERPMDRMGPTDSLAVVRLGRHTAVSRVYKQTGKSICCQLPSDSQTLVPSEPDGATPSPERNHGPLPGCLGLAPPPGVRGGDEAYVAWDARTDPDLTDPFNQSPWQGRGDMRMGGWGEGEDANSHLQGVQCQ